MGHNHEEEKQENYIILRIFISIVLFVFGFAFKPLFILAYIVSGYDVIYRAIKNIFKVELFDENFLMSLATVGALCIKEYPEAVMVIVLYQIGEFLQDRAIHKSKNTIMSLMEFRPDFVIIDGEKRKPEDIKIGDIITIKAGERIPLDGVVVEGNASVDFSALTGESVPVDVSVNSEVLSGGVNLNGVLKIRATKEFKQSTISIILELIEHSAEKKSKAEKFITKFSKIYTPAVVILAITLVAGLTIFTHIGFLQSLERALTFLVISCPCALVISVPLTFFAGIGGASKNGILIKGGNYLEQLSKINTVVFDKTGTLTTGVFGIREINSNNPEFKKYAAIAESASSHPLAKAVRAAYNENLPQITEITEFAGGGVEAVYDSKRIKAGTAKFVGVEPADASGTIIYVSLDGDYIGNIVLSDIIREDSEETIKKLSDMNIKTVLLTGDTKERTETLKSKLNINEIYSELLPADKVQKVEEFICSGCTPLAFVGDGINDAPVLKRADVGIAMGGIGSDAALEASDVVLMEDKPSKIITAINISKKTMMIVRQNIIFSIGVKVIFLILGGFGFMTMWGAVFADVGVALLAIMNSLRAKN